MTKSISFTHSYLNRKAILSQAKFYRREFPPLKSSNTNHSTKKRPKVHSPQRHTRTTQSYHFVTIKTVSKGFNWVFIVRNALLERPATRFKRRNASKKSTPPYGPSLPSQLAKQYHTSSLIISTRIKRQESRCHSQVVGIMRRSFQRLTAM